MVNAYLIVKNVEGPSTSRETAIDILSFSFGAEMVAAYQAAASGKESRTGRAKFNNLTITKVVDKTTPILFDHCVTGDVLEEVTLFYDKAVNDAQEDFFTVQMTDAVITNISMNGSQENPVESISFAFQKVKVGYAPEKDDGMLDGMVFKGYDLDTLKPV
jgi:type VI secretion system secreted protein Hcp